MYNNSTLSTTLAQQGYAYYKAYYNTYYNV